MKKHAIVALFLALAVLSLPACGHHHHGSGSSSPSPAPNPANANYTIVEVAHHQPGFFSCYWLGGLNMGTYMDYAHKHDMQAQFCRLEGNRVVVKHVVRGAESIYNLIKLDDNSLFASCEQKNLLGIDLNGHAWVIHPKHLGMGHYWTGWWKGKWVTTEKDTISTNNKSQVWVGGNLLYQSSEFTWKEGIIKGDDIYLASYFIHKRTEGGLLKVNLNTGQASLLYSQRWTGCYCVGLNEATGEVLYSLEHGNSSTICIAPHQPIQEIPAKAWRIRYIKNAQTLFLTASLNGWRKGGPSYVFVWDTMARQFVLKTTIPSGASEPWDICGSGNPDVFYLVTRDESKGNLGKVFKITRTW